jgi:hypothetical protein
MKGKLSKKDNNWYVMQVQEGDWETHYLLYPDDVKQIEADAKVFDNIEARIAAYPDVEFEVIDEFTHPHLYENVGWGDGIIYARLLHTGSKTPSIYESPDKGVTVYERKAGDYTSRVKHMSEKVPADLKTIQSYIKQYPNDQDLGEQIRKAYRP